MDITRVRNLLETLPDEIFEFEQNYLEQKALLDHMDDLKKHLIANLKNNSKETSNAAREDDALGSSQYRTHIDGRKEQALVVSKLAAEFHKLERTFEAMRSLNKNV